MLWGIWSNDTLAEMSADWKSPFSEEEYLKYLASERHLFAWCLTVYGDLSPQSALAEAEKFYRYQSPDEPCRGLVFHDEPWHWAMLKLFGNLYWKSHPELEVPSAAYRLRAKE